jgi:hypothetical protein
MELKAGSRLRSVVDPTEVIVVKAPKGEVDLRCGGTLMVAMDQEPNGQAALDPAFAEGSQIGKRYASEDVGIEVLCTKAGQGSLSVGAEVLPIKTAKALPSSD